MGKRGLWDTAEWGANGTTFAEGFWQPISEWLQDKNLTSLTSQLLQQVSTGLSLQSHALSCNLLPETGLSSNTASCFIFLRALISSCYFLFYVLLSMFTHSFLSLLCNLLQSSEHLSLTCSPPYSQLPGARRSTMRTNDVHYRVISITKTGNELNVYQKEKWLNKSWYIHTMKYYEAIYWPVGKISIIYCFVDKAICKILRIIFLWKWNKKTCAWLYVYMFE